MKTPEEIYDEAWNELEFSHSKSKPIALEAMKRFGYQCWIDSAQDFAVSLGSRMKREDRIIADKPRFKKYLKDLYLNEIAKQAQDDGECK